MSDRDDRSNGFTLVEVVLALGVIAFAVVAILGAMPLGLQSTRSSQDQTRAAQIAQDIFASLASQSPTKFPHVVIAQPATATSSDFSFNIDLDTARQYDTMAANNEGQLIALASVADAVNYPYQIIVQVAPDPSGFSAGFATQITVRVITPPVSNPNQALPTGHTARDYTRIISKY